jgi:hypothetical protein
MECWSDGAMIKEMIEFEYSNVPAPILRYSSTPLLQLFDADLFLFLNLWI